MLVTLTLEQKKDIARRMEEGYRFAELAKDEEARTMLPEVRWRKIEAIQGFTELFPSPKIPDADAGERPLVLQQRRFAKIRDLQ